MKFTDWLSFDEENNVEGMLLNQQSIRAEARILAMKTQKPQSAKRRKAKFAFGIAGR
jgi:hypothetical protein